MYNIGVCGVGRESGCVIGCYVGFLGGVGWCKPNVHFSLHCFTFGLHFCGFLGRCFCFWFTLLYFCLTGVDF